MANSPDAESSNPIVVPLDGSELAERAVAVAAASNRSLRLMRADHDHAAVEARTYLDSTAGFIDGVDVDQQVILDREAADSIVLAAGSGLVCMATHGRRGPTRSLLGSVAADVLARVTGPVIVVGPHVRTWARSNGGTVVAAVESGTAGDSVAKAAASFALERGAGLALLQVHRPMPDVIAAGADAPDTGWLETTVARLSDRLPCRGISERGSDPASVLVDCTDEIAATWAVVHYERPHRLGGSVALAAVRHLRCPLLVLATEKQP